LGSTFSLYEDTARSVEASGFHSGVSHRDADAGNAHADLELILLVGHVADGDYCVLFAVPHTQHVPLVRVAPLVIRPEQAYPGLDGDDDSGPWELLKLKHHCSGEDTTLP